MIIGSFLHALACASIICRQLRMLTYPWQVFMLSLSHENQYYQVSVIHSHGLQSSQIMCKGFPVARHLSWPISGIVLYAKWAIHFTVWTTSVQEFLALAIVSHYFHQRRPLAMGLVTAGSALGSSRLARVFCAVVSCSIHRFRAPSYNAQ